VQGREKSGSYIYVICSSGQDHFSEIAAISIASLRLVCSAARITVVTDHRTATIMSPGLAAIRPVVDEFCVFDVPGTTPFVRSRFLKASLRSLLPGRLLYLDSDTIFMRSPHKIWDIDADIAAAPDLSPEGRSYPASNAQSAAMTKLGWRLSSRPYLNAGVIYFSDSEASFAIGAQFRKFWLEHSRVTESHQDQLAFNHALQATTARLHILPGIYNAQIRMNVLALRGAVIVHYFTGNLENSEETIAHTLGRKLKQDGILDTTALKHAIEIGNPWTRIDSYRKAVATRRYASIGRIALERIAKRVIS
jgi:hypothetical protein